MLRFFVVVIVGCFLPSIGMAEVKRLVVLDFTGVAIEENMLTLLSEQASSGIVQITNQDEILVMTREAMAQILQDMGKDIRCVSGQCEVELARNMGADYVVSGMVIKAEEEYALTLKLHNSRTAALLSSQIQYADSLSNLGKQTSELAKELLLEGLKSSKSPQVSSVPLEEAKAPLNMVGNVGMVRFESNPKGGIVFLDGHLICEPTPCEGKVPLGVHQVSMQKELYITTSEKIKLQKEKDVQMDLIPDFGSLDVGTSVGKVMIHMDGKPLGMTPLKNVKIEKGEHVLSVADSCHVGEDYEFSSRVGGHEQLTDYPVKKKMTKVQIFVNPEGKPMPKAKIYVDGEFLGVAPLSKEIPLCSKEAVAVINGKEYRKQLLLTEDQAKIVFRFPKKRVPIRKAGYRGR